MIVKFRRPASDATMLAPGMRFGGGAIRQIVIDPIPPGPQTYDPYVTIEVEVFEAGHPDLPHCGDPNCCCPTNAQMDALFHAIGRRP